MMRKVRVEPEHRNTTEVRLALFNGTMKPGHDGVTRVLYKLLDHLNLVGTPCECFSTIIPEKHLQTVPMHRVPSVQFPLYTDYRLALPGWKSFEQQMRQFSPTLIHINSPCSLGCAAAHYGRRFGIPVVATYHTHFPSYARYYRLMALEPCGWNYLRGLYNSCTRTFVPSRPILQELELQGIHNLEWLPHGVDTKIFDPRFRSPEWRLELGLTAKTVLFYAGRLVWEKDLRTLVEAWSMLREQHPDAALVLAGDGPARAEIRTMLPDAVFLGQLGGKALATAFASADIFVFPSTTETFGNVILEAMASGLVPVCAHTGGAVDLIQDGVSGFLARPKDPRHFADRVSHLIADPSLRCAMAERGLLRAQMQSWGTVLSQLMESYHATVSSYVPTPRGRRRRAA
ncbi:MAG: glycosyltransferase family 1 protein [Bacteroidetes bacterium]|nr:glycosyltransferase family 1 protein [Bacteroidota bacterium]